MSEVGGGREEIPHVRGRWRPGGATSRPRSGVAAGRRHPASEVRGRSWERLSGVRGQGWLGQDTPRLRSGAAGRRHPASEARGGDPAKPP